MHLTVLFVEDKQHPAISVTVVVQCLRNFRGQRLYVECCHSNLTAFINPIPLIDGFNVMSWRPCSCTGTTRFFSYMK